MHIFHSPALHRITSLSSYFTPFYFPFSFFEDTEKFNVLGLVSGKSYSKRVVLFDLPFDFTKGDQHRNLKRLLVTINSKFRDCVYIEIRNLGNLNYFDRNIIFSDYNWYDWQNIIIDTKDSEYTWNKINESKKRQIKSSLEKGAEIKEAENESQVLEFYQLLKKLYRTKIHKPLPDWNFFKAFFHETRELEFGRYLLIKYNEKIIAGMLCPVSPVKEAYEWYIAGLDKEFRGTGIYPSVLATWAGIDFAVKNNIPRFNFMGAGQTGKQYGVRDFKMQFGGELVNSGRYVKVNKPFLYNLGKLYFRLREVI